MREATWGKRHGGSEMGEKTMVRLQRGYIMVGDIGTPRRGERPLRNKVAISVVTFLIPLDICSLNFGSYFGGPRRGFFDFSRSLLQIVSVLWEAKIKIHVEIWIPKVLKWPENISRFRQGSLKHRTGIVTEAMGTIRGESQAP